MVRKDLRTSDFSNGEKHSAAELNKIAAGTHPKQANAMVCMNFVVSRQLRNAFKAKAASRGVKIRDVLTTYMENYVKSND